jgi:hypothetical protein
VISSSCRLLGRGINLDITDAGRRVVEMICENMTILDDERKREVNTIVVKEIRNLHLQARGDSTSSDRRSNHTNILPIISHNSS